MTWKAATTLALAFSLSATYLPAHSQDDAERFKTAERLKQAGMNAGAISACQLAGYDADYEYAERYLRQEVDFAKADGVFEVISRNYIKLGMDSQVRKDVDTLQALRRLIDAKDARAPRAIAWFVDDLVDRCDLIAARSETRPMFSYVPSSLDVSRLLVRKGLGVQRK